MDNDDRHGEPPPSDNDSNVDDYYDDVEDDGGGGGDEDEDDDDEDDRDGKIFIPYEQRPEWDDITPCQPDPLEPDVLSILFTPQFRNVHGYFRAVFKNNELSLRSLKVTEECISYNPANSTTWSFRRKILLHLKCDLREELDYISSVIKSSPKNYQVWQHRKWIVQQLNQPDFEKSFTSQLFGMDSKNYHAWQHRQWVISHFNLWNGELEFSEQLIDNDVLNNSAWNHRYFVVKGLDKFDDEKFISTEVTFVLQKIKKMSSNESPWNYLRGILKKIGLNKFPQLVQTLNFYVDESLHSLAFQIDAIEETLACQDNPDQALLNKAIGIADKLKNQVDPIRSTYWEFVSRSLIAKYSSKK